MIVLLFSNCKINLGILSVYLSIGGFGTSPNVAPPILIYLLSHARSGHHDKGSGYPQHHLSETHIDT